MTITFVHSHRAFVPEVQAYSSFFGSLGHECRLVRPDQIAGAPTDVEWHFIGMDRHRSTKGRIKIHEYLTRSVGTFGPLKDYAKKLLNVKPDYRIFLNAYVKKHFSFLDDVPSGFRDMGIDPAWEESQNISQSPEFDFVYVGDLSKARELEKLFDAFTRPALQNRSLLIAGRDYAALQEKYSGFPNLIFQGPFDHQSMPSILQKARYGINYIADKEPFNQQTSTKFLEYAACRLPVITTRYNWLNNFQKEYGGNYFYLEPDLSNLDWESIQRFSFAKPDLTQWSWEMQIRRSGVVEFLEKVQSEKRK
jgi:glycosyltransferase involved in cell wall biosynthesis